MIVVAAQLGTALLAQAAAPAPEDVISYRIRKGDTLDALSRAYLVSGRDWRQLQRLVKVRDPRRLPAERSLAIPRSWLRYRIEPARLASYRGMVRITAEGRSLPLAAGSEIGEGAEIATGANSFVTLMLADRSKVVIPSQSRVRVRELRRILLTGAIEYRIEVQAGRLETKVTPVGDPSGRYRISTPISMTAVRGTEFRIAYPEGSPAAATEVLDGKVAVSAPQGSGETLVDRGFGATTSAAGDSRIAALLAAPELADPGQIQTRDEVSFKALPLAAAARYRLVLAADAGFVENLAEQSSDAGLFSFADIPNGTLFARISAIGADGLEGLAQTYSFRRQLASIHAEVGQSADGFRFRWFGAGEGQRRYRFQLYRGPGEGRPLIDEVGLTEDSLTLRSLPPGVYSWRVGLAQNADGEDIESWTDFEELTVSAPARPRKR